jgi:ubiquinone/menaquinone biosynthesis C-methylase UbiE
VIFGSLQKLLSSCFSYSRTLEKVQSKDPELRKQGKFTLLEVGIASGSNFAFYPDNAVVTGVDKNPFFFDQLRKKLTHEHPNIDFRGFHVQPGENLVDFADNSFDVVVCTFVMCRSSNLTAFLAEVRRVLVPGGRFYFWEHVADRYGTRRRTIQRIAAPFWYWFNDGCKLTQRVVDEIEKSGFTVVDKEFFNVRPKPSSSTWEKFRLKYLTGYHVHGIAFK